MTALTYPKFQVQNISGVNASSGKVYFYSSGTSTAKDTYSDIALTILNTNPVVLNARGEADIYLDGEYKIVLELNGSIEWTEDAYKTPADRVGDALRADLASTDTDKGISFVGNSIQLVANIATLRTITGTTTRNIQTRGYYVEGDGGGGVFYWDSASTASDNGGTIIKVTTITTGRWLRVLSSRVINALWFGSKGDDSTNNFATLTNTIAYVASIRGVLLLPSNHTFRYETALTVDATTYANFTIQGESFSVGGSTLKPVDCAAFNFDGALATGGFVFNITLKDFTFDCSLVTIPITDLARWDDFYRCKMQNVWFRGVAVEPGVTVTNVVKTEGTCYESVFRRTYVVGTGNTGAGNGFNFAHTIGHLLLDQPDSENLNTSFYLSADTNIDMLSPHIERQGIGFNIQPGTIDGNGHINIYGGSCDLPSASSSGFLMAGTFDKNEIINVDGLRFTSNNHTTKTNAFNVGSLVWNNAAKINLSNIDWSWITAPAALKEPAYITPFDPYALNALQKSVYTIQQTGVVDNTATDVFKLDAFDTASPFPPVYVKIKAFISHNGFGRAIEESVFIIQDRGTPNAYVSTKQIIAEVREADSANYSITTFFITATENADDITFDITSDFNNTVVTTIDPYFEVEVIGDATFTAL